MTDTTDRPFRWKYLRARVFSLGMLAGVSSGLVYCGRVAYHAVRDSYVAPLILTPDSDIVITSQLKINELAVERARAAADLEGCNADLQAAGTAIERLGSLRETISTGRAWFTKEATRKARAATDELSTLADQAKVLGDMLREQSELTRRAEADVQAGIISRHDFAAETQSLDHIELALLENERARMKGKAQLEETRLARRALAGRTDAMPEVTSHEEQLVRIEMEIVRLEADKRSKSAQHDALVDRIAKIDDLSRQLKSKPFIRAAQGMVNLAFVPYSQLDGVEVGAEVYDCVWGLFLCDAAGTVTEILPGEVLLTDPWGSPARGQYAVLQLTAPDAARSKILRVRSTGESEAHRAHRQREETIAVKGGAK